MKMRKIFAVMLLMVMAFSANVMTAQEMPTIPVDDAVRVGKLPCGLTYYIRHNDYPEHRVNFYIAQRVGALQEEESQRGLAHFLEHMAFNGSEHFNGEGKGIIDYTRSLGVNFGGDLNAYTSIAETVYNINDVPSTRQSAIDSCLLILKDWSNGLLLTDEEIDKERGVIHEEWRLGQGPDMRMFERQLETLYPGSKYGKRFPIGLMSVVDNFEYKELRDYYHKWYRPDNQALVIVGDVDVDHIEAQIKEMYKNYPAPDPNAAQVVDEPVPDNEEPIIVVDKDKEQQYSQVYVMFKHDAVDNENKTTVDYLVYQYAQYIISSMLNDRLNEKAQEPDCPFNHASADDDSYIFAKTKDAFALEAMPKEGQTEAATQALMTEAMRALKYGFTATEYARAKDNYVSWLEKQYNERDKVSNATYAYRYYRNYLDNEPMPSVEQRYQWMSMIIPNITVDMINGMLPELISDGNKNLVIMNFNQEKDGAVYPTAESLMTAINTARNSNIEAYVDNVKDEPLMTQMPKAGKIVKESENTTFGYKELELSNGARVILKKTDFKQDEIRMSAFQRGGQSLYEEKDRMNLQMLSQLNSFTGVGSFNNTELDKALAGKQASAYLNIGNMTDGISGQSTIKDLETMFQLVYLKFTALNKDEKKFNQIMGIMETQLKNKSFQPESVLSDTLMYVMNDRTWRAKPVNVEDLKEVNLDRIMEIAKERTANAANYTFTFVGAFDEATIRPLIEQYIASLPAKKGVKSNWKGYQTFPKGETLNHFTHKMETPKDYEVVVWHDTEIPYSLENSIKTDILGQILSRVYLQKIREDAGAAYSAFAQGGMAFTGKGYITQVLAVCPVKPEFKDEALKIMKDEMVKACSEIDATALKEAQENLVKDHATYMKENWYWLSNIQQYLIFGQDDMTGYEQIVKAQTPESIAAFARQLYNAGNRIEVVMTPAE
ncbi:MAG: insulinase family protein [Muribaculaceae bacterium]|nr:insulinase family protein [Muribaculaceae bacterium]